MMATPGLPGCLPGEIARAYGELVEAIGPTVESHPGKELSDHLRGVWTNCAALTESLEAPVDLRALALGALTHDTGKAAPAFQAHLYRKGKGVNHAFPSAWFTLLLARQCGDPIERAIWAAEAVRRHHTQLVSFAEIASAWDADDRDDRAITANMRNLLPRYAPRLAGPDFEALHEAFFDLEDRLDASTWLQLRLQYSLLVAADRMDAIGLHEPGRRSFPPFSLPVFPETPGAQGNEDPVAKWRGSVQEECFQHALQVIRGPGVYTLTLPTGAGKTLTGLRIADHLIRQGFGHTLIYALPFISIVEQTTDVACSVYGETSIQEDHSLREVDLGEDETDRWKQMACLFRYWHSPVVLTTLAQLWEAIFSPRANRAMNFHRLCGAVIILDEPQTIPAHLWAPLGDVFRFLSRELGTTVLLMTATQPHIARDPAKKGELAPQPYRFPHNRHHYSAWAIDREFEIDEALQALAEKGLFEKHSGLAVFNTRASALAGFDLLEGRLAPDGSLKLLSAWLTPWRRRQALAEIRLKLENRLPLFLVSTQVIEAGVDLDFEWVFRDLGPLDSIIQVAGRCNRHYRRKTPGQVVIARLCQKTNGRRISLARQVYDQVLLDATLQVLSKNPIFDETDVPRIVDEYYARVASSVTPAEVFKELSRGEWGKERPLYTSMQQPGVPLVIEENETVRGLVEALESRHWALEYLLEKRRLMQELQQYIIEVPLRKVPALRLKAGRILAEQAVLAPILGDTMLFLSREGIGEDPACLYHPVKGLVPPAEAGEALIF